MGPDFCRGVPNAFGTPARSEEPTDAEKLRPGKFAGGNLLPTRVTLLAASDEAPRRDRSFEADYAV
jgi:hypothetical protein